MTPPARLDGAISPEGMALLRRLRIQYRDRPALYRDLLTLTIWAMTADGHQLDRAAVDQRSSLTSDEVAVHLGVTPRSARRLCALGILAAAKRGGRWWVDRGALATYQASTTRGEPACPSTTAHRPSASAPPTPQPSTRSGPGTRPAPSAPPPATTS